MIRSMLAYLRSLMAVALDFREFAPCCYRSAAHQCVRPGLQTSPITDPTDL